jgi:hypothetical protein
MLYLSRLRAFVIWFLCLAVALASWRFLALGVEASMEFVAYHAIERRLAFFAHITLAPVALMLMPFQYWKGLRMRRPLVHRWIGRAYGVSILLAGVGSILMAFGTTAGPVAAWGFGRFLAGQHWLWHLAGPARAHSRASALDVSISCADLCCGYPAAISATAVYDTG